MQLLGRALFEERLRFMQAMRFFDSRAQLRKMPRVDMQLRKAVSGVSISAMNDCPVFTPQQRRFMYQQSRCICISKSLGMHWVVMTVG
jgi:hypothetical protein